MLQQNEKSTQINTSYLAVFTNYSKKAFAKNQI